MADSDTHIKLIIADFVVTIANLRAEIDALKANQKQPPRKKDAQA